MSKRILVKRGKKGMKMMKYGKHFAYQIVKSTHEIYPLHQRSPSVVLLAVLVIGGCHVIKAWVVLKKKAILLQLI